jgi:hypothetical protein
MVGCRRKFYAALNDTNANLIYNNANKKEDSNKSQA